jgi:hypothetical protein
VRIAPYLSKTGGLQLLLLLLRCCQAVTSTKTGSCAMLPLDATLTGAGGAGSTGKSDGSGASLSPTPFTLFALTVDAAAALTATQKQTA